MIFFYLTLIAVLNLFPFSSPLAGSAFENVSMKKFTSPKYNEETHKLEYIVTGSNAKTIGAYIKMTNVKIEMIGSMGESIDSVITTPEAFYNRTSQLVKGDKPIHYQSLAANIDGIGFDCNMKTQLFHIRKNVKMLITSAAALQGGDDVSPVQTGKNNTIQDKTKDTKTENINSSGNAYQKKTSNASTVNTINKN